MLWKDFLLFLSHIVVPFLIPAWATISNASSLVTPIRRASVMKRLIKLRKLSFSPCFTRDMVWVSKEAFLPQLNCLKKSVDNCLQYLISPDPYLLNRFEVASNKYIRKICTGHPSNLQDVHKVFKSAEVIFGVVVPSNLSIVPALKLLEKSASITV